LERDLISLRTKEALAAKKQQGVRLGKPKGTIQKSKFDADLERIKDLLKLGLSVRKIATLLGYKNHLALNTYINKRKLHGQGSLLDVREGWLCFGEAGNNSGFFSPWQALAGKRVRKNVMTPKMSFSERFDACFGHEGRVSWSKN
jgi:hypothetical protein